MRIIKYIGIALMAAVLSIGLPSPTKVKAQPGVTVSFQMFFNTLSPFGRWSNHPQFGSIWVPSVNRDFHPYYTDGRWVMTEFGNTWVSDYDWGWAPFHYGRWFHDDYLGWAWVPDYTWGPGWVNWRTGGGYYGWAPLMPGLDVRISVNLPINFWIFVPQRHFMANRWHKYSVPRGRVTNIYNQTTIINNYYNYNKHEYAYGPRSSDIQTHTRNAVPVYDYSRRSDNGKYRETVARNNSATSRTAVNARERSFDSSPALAAPSSGRKAAAVNPETRSSSAARTNSSSTTRSANPTTTPSDRGNVRERSNASPNARTGTGSTESGARSREAVAPRQSDNIRSNSGSPARRSEATPAPNRSNAREASPQRGSRTSATPANRSGAERVAPSNSRSRESVSPSRSSSRESVSPARSTTPTRNNPASSGRNSRNASGERGGRQ